MIISSEGLYLFFDYDSGNNILWIVGNISISIVWYSWLLYFISYAYKLLIYYYEHAKCYINDYSWYLVSLLSIYYIILLFWIFLNKRLDIWIFVRSYIIFQLFYFYQYNLLFLLVLVINHYSLVYLILTFMTVFIDWCIKILN